MSDESPSQALLEIYRKNPFVQALIQLLPYGLGPYADAKLKQRIERYRDDRLRVFFTELSKGKICLTPDLIDQDDFLFCYFKTIAAVQRSRRSEKIIYLARLLSNYFSEQHSSDADEYEELISTIEDLSFNELKILSILARYEREFPPEADKNELQRTERYWMSFKNSVSSNLNVAIEMVYPMLLRLQRSGCYQEFVGGFWDYAGDRGNLTPIYYRLEKIAGALPD